MLTHTAILKAKPADKPYKLQREHGLFVLVQPNGGKWWRFSYSYGGKEKLLSLGTFPLISLPEARRLRDEARKLVAAGIDPSEHRRNEREAKAMADVGTFSAVLERWQADTLTRTSESYSRNVLRVLERDVLPYIGERPITEIKTRELVAVLDRIRDRGLVETSRRARSVIGQVFRYAIRRGIAENDPTYAMRGEKRLRPVKHFAALKLSALLFQRPGEIRQMQWQQLDLNAAEWRYVVSKTNTPHVVPLPSQAVAILRDLYPLTGHALSLKPDQPRYVFPTPKTRLRPLSENAVRQALRNMGFTNEEMTAHGFRAMARSLLAERRWDRDAIERQLAHKPAGPLGAAYDRAAFLDERRRMMQDWADYLDALRTGNRGATVAQLYAA